MNGGHGKFGLAQIVAQRAAGEAHFVFVRTPIGAAGEGFGENGGGGAAAHGAGVLVGGVWRARGIGR
ncbi:hypothetical protein D3C81_2238230 [compost metagenome]